jgi:hypothetical protein
VSSIWSLNWAGIIGPWHRKQSPPNPSIKSHHSCPHLHSLTPHTATTHAPEPEPLTPILSVARPPLAHTHASQPSPMVAGSILPQAATVFTEELPPDLMPLKPHPETLPPDLLLPAAALLSSSFCRCHCALRRISRRGDALPTLDALPLRRRLKNYDHMQQHI